MSDKKIPLMECFGPTIQGEGITIGQQTYFLRFGLCDSHCQLCDSIHAVDPMQVKLNAEWLTQREIFETLLRLKEKLPNSTNWVTFSGGNPCIHDLTELTQLLKQDSWKIAVETQGTKCPNWLKFGGVDICTVSPKSPGMKDKPIFDHEEFTKFLRDIVHGRVTSNSRLVIKVVIFDDADIEFAAILLKRYDIHPRAFYLSLGNPFWNEDVDADSLTHRLRFRYLDLLSKTQNHPTLSKVKFLPQLHTWLWGNQKGV